MQVRWGLSYKDAAHRLHMMEVQKLLAEKKAQSALTDTLDRIDAMVQGDMLIPITDIDARIVDPND
jgi:phage gp36-like protein